MSTSMPNLGANSFSFTGDRTQIDYMPIVPGPRRAGEDIQGGKLDYQGQEGDLTFQGQTIRIEDSPLGTLLTVTLKPNNDTGGISLTLVLPRVFVNGEQPLTFQALAIKSTGRGFTASPGVDHTYTLIPLVGTARNVILPL